MFGDVHFSNHPDPNNVARLDHNALPLIHWMEAEGIRVDIPFLKSLDAEVLSRQLEVDSQIRSTIGNTYQDFDGNKHQPLNIGSPDQIARLLFQHLQIQGGAQLEMTKAGKREIVDDDVLAQFDKSHPVVPLIREYRMLDKLHGTYTLPLQLHADSNSRIHTSFNVTVAATGRLSSSKPNLQQIPVRTELGKKVRNAFIASAGCSLVGADLSQIEMRWAAHRSQDPTMMGVFFKDEDVHTRTACNVYGLNYSVIMDLAARVDGGTATEQETKEYKYFKNFQRLPCKTVGFGVLYGQTAEGLQASLATEGVHWTLEECQDFIDNKFFEVYQKLREMLNRDYATAMRYGLGWDDFGRVRLIPEAKSTHKWIVSEGVRKAGNHSIQGSAQGTLKLAMAELFYIMKDINRTHRCVPLLQIHDELISDVDHRVAREFGEAKKAVFEQASPISVPIKSSMDVAERWGELK